MSMAKILIGVSPRGVGEGRQSIKTLKNMLTGNSFRTVRTCQVLLDGEPCEVEFAKVKSSAEFVIAHLNWNTQYIAGRYEKRRPKARRTVGIPICADAVQKVLDAPEGMIECYGELPKDVGQVSRFGIAWWSNDTHHKYIRFFGDRVHLNFKHPAVPRLFSFGQHPYHVLFECNDPFHCLRCRKDLKMGQGKWQNNSFICDDCEYEQETGFRPGINKLRKKKAK